MAIKILIPTPLQKLTNGQTEISITDKMSVPLSELIEELDVRHSGFKERIYDENGKIRRFINIYVNGEDIRFLQGQETNVKDGDEISIVPAIAGG